MVTTACYTSYQFSTHINIIKYEMEVGVRDVDCYVAPTFINLENPTFWMNQGNIGRTGFGAGVNTSKSEGKFRPSFSGNFDEFFYEGS
jgi:hypothetical protein